MCKLTGRKKEMRGLKNVCARVFVSLGVCLCMCVSMNISEAPR